MMDESEACSLPGGLASVKRQFEKQEFSSTSSQSSVTQFHFEQRSVQVRAQSRISPPPTQPRPNLPPKKTSRGRPRVMCTSVSDNSRIGKLLSFFFLI